MGYFFLHALSFLKRVKSKIIYIPRNFIKVHIPLFSIISRKLKKFYQKYKNQFLILKFQNIYELQLKSIIIIRTDLSRSN